MHPDRVSRSIPTYSNIVLQEISCTKQPNLIIPYANILFRPPVFMAPLHLFLTKNVWSLRWFYIYTFSTSTEKRSMQSPLAHKHYTTICIMFSSRLLVYDIIQLTFTDLNQISIFNSTHYFLLYSPYRFDSNFPIQIPILFYYNYINLTENLWFNSAFLIQLNSSFTIQFDLVNHFFSTHTARIWIIVSD